MHDLELYADAAVFGIDYQDLIDVMVVIGNHLADDFTYPANDRDHA